MVTKQNEMDATKYEHQTDKFCASLVRIIR